MVLLPAIPIAALCAASTALAPAAALASSGGAAAPTGPAASTVTATPTPAATSTPSSSTPTTSAAASTVPSLERVKGAVSLTLRSSAMIGNGLDIRGYSGHALAGRAVTIERNDPLAGWVVVATTTMDAHGSFAAVWHTDTIGRFPLRAVTGSSGPESSYAAGVSSPAATVTVYQPAIATWYGPGFYGNTTACGQVLTTSTLGVANRTLPCGTLVNVFYNGQSLVVPVIDRGPFANNATWDLTGATATALGITGTETVGTFVVGQTTPTPALGQPTPQPVSPTTGATAAPSGAAVAP
jgi:rare lipoprotein A